MRVNSAIASMLRSTSLGGAALGTAALRSEPPSAMLGSAPRSAAPRSAALRSAPRSAAAAQRPHGSASRSCYAMPRGRARTCSSSTRGSSRRRPRPAVASPPPRSTWSAAAAAARAPPRGSARTSASSANYPCRARSSNAGGRRRRKGSFPTSRSRVPNRTPPPGPKSLGGGPRDLTRFSRFPDGFRRFVSPPLSSLSSVVRNSTPRAPLRWCAHRARESGRVSPPPPPARRETTPLSAPPCPCRPPPRLPPVAFASDRGPWLSHRSSRRRHGRPEGCKSTCLPCLERPRWAPPKRTHYKGGWMVTHKPKRQCSNPRRSDTPACTRPPSCLAPRAPQICMCSPTTASISAGVVVDRRKFPAP